MQPVRLPTTVNAARILAVVQGVLGILGGLALLIAAQNATAVSRIADNINANSTTTVTLDQVKAVLVVFGIITMLIGVALIWLGIAVGRLRAGARVALIVIEAILTLLSLPGLARGGAGFITAALAIAVLVLLLLPSTGEAFTEARDRRARAAAGGGHLPGYGPPPGYGAPPYGPPPGGYGPPPGGYGTPPPPPPPPEQPAPPTEPPTPPPA